MTTGNDPALPAIDDNNPPASPSNEPPAGGLTFTSPQPADQDDAELTAAEAEAKAEEAPGSGEGQPAAPQDPAQPGTSPAATNGQNPPAQPAAPIMVPKARLDETLRALDTERLERARLEGRLEATQRMAPGQPAPGKAPPQPQQTPVQRLEAIHAAQDALAARFDSGEITAADWKREERKLNADEQALREEQFVARLQPAAAPQPNDELYLETLTAKLENDHPWTIVFEKVGTDADWDYLKAVAVQDLTAAGKQLDMNKTVDRYELRKAISEAADRLGPSLVAQRATAQGIALPGQQQPPARAGTPPLSPQAQARLNGLEKRANAPPDIAALPGHGSDPAGVPSEAAVEAMTDDDFDRLPTAVTNRMRGITA